MKNLILAAGVAALAIAAPASAEKGGKGGGGGGGHKMERGGGGGGGGHRMERGGGGGGHKMERGGGGHRMEHRGGGGGGHAMRMERRGGDHAMKMERRGGGGQAMKMERRGGGGHAMKMERRGGGGHAMKMERGGGGNREFRADRRGNDRQVARMQRQERRMVKERGNERRAFAEQRQRRFDDRRQVERNERRMYDTARVERVRDRDWNDNVRVAGWDSDFDRWENVRGRSYSCPPGLAAKGNGCLPPGQAKKLMGSVLPAAYASSYLPDALRSYYQDDDDYYYRYGDGYVYRVDRDNDLISSLLPLFGGSYAMGQAFPLSNPDYYVPSYYSSFYPDTQYGAYRYDDGYLYQVDPYSGLVQDVSPMLGYGYGVGQILPAGYSAYNVPYQYRDMYYDTDEAYYRYAPGAIYQVDPQTNLITSVASLLTGQPLGIGQSLPMGYDAYNVPYAYRDRYYDTDDSWYRYADGNIYQVDPTTRLITAVIDAIV